MIMASATTVQAGEASMRAERQFWGEAGMGGAATCEPSELGPECAYDEETAGTADDPCLAYSNCVRCAKTTHGGAHYCTDVAA